MNSVNFFNFLKRTNCLKTLYYQISSLEKNFYRRFTKKLEIFINDSKRIKIA